MSLGILIILAIPSAVLFFRYSDRKDIVIQFIIVFALLILGWRIIKSGGCLFRILGIILFILGIAAFYYLIIQPFFTGQITTFGILN